MEKLCPSRSSTVVRASRLFSEGTIKPEIVTACCKVEFAHRWRQAQIDNAVFQDRRVEGQLHAERLVLDGNDRTPPVAPVAVTTGTGYSPPARNEAVSPESAISSGSANWRINPLVSKAVRRTSRLMTVGGEIGERNAKRRCAGQQCACSSK